jgi:hypothetical protein
MPESPTPPALEYSRLLYANVLEWYKTADIKAQVILSVNGLFLGVTTSTLFAKRTDLREVLITLPASSWYLFLAMAVCIAISIALAIAALSSQLNLPTPDRVAYTEQNGQKVCDPQVMWFFQAIAKLDRESFRLCLHSVDDNFQVDILASQIHKLAQNVRWKHVMVNCAFILFGLGLVLFIGSAAAYWTSLRF